MPRLPPWLLRQAARQSPDLAALLPACRDLDSARNELRWIGQHVRHLAPVARRARLTRLCELRGRRVPLQYVLGSQPFGHLDIACRPGVLIPRAETEAYTCHLVDLIRRRELLGPEAAAGDGLNIVDFCTGTGCIPLLLFASLQPLVSRLKVLGVDIADAALELARHNIRRSEALGDIGQPTSQQSLQVSRADVFSDGDIRSLAATPWDLVISNPPYVSRDVWTYGRGQLGYSVRKYEPKLALVPGQGIAVREGWVHHDMFYARLLDVAQLLQPKLLLLELGDEAQARRVLGHLRRLGLASTWAVEVWRDWPDVAPRDAQPQTLTVLAGSGRPWVLPVKGSGQIRSLFMQKKTT